MTETSLGITLMILVTIGGNEIANLVHPIAALVVISCACIVAGVAYTRTGANMRSSRE